MAKLNISQKANRTGKLLWGMRHPAISAALAPFGFTAEVLDEGWALVKNVNDLQLARVVSRPTAFGQGEIIGKADAFENRWFPIAKNALARNYPAITEKLFLNLGRNNGHTAAYSVGTFIDRLGAMEKGESPFGVDGVEARKFLAKRGLSDSVVAQIVADLEGRKEVVAGSAPEPFDEAALAEAEAKMWAFYLDWSTVIREVVTDGNLLRLVGFKKRSSGTRTPKAPTVGSAAAPSADSDEANAAE